MSVISHEREAAANLVRRYSLSAADLVVEVGSGAGEYLRAIQSLGPRVLGIEPDVQSMAKAWSAGVDTIAVRFGPGAAEYVRDKYGPVKLLLARNVPPGGEEFAKLVAAGARCLAADGAIAILGSGTNAVMEVRPDAVLRRAA